MQINVCLSIVRRVQTLKREICQEAWSLVSLGPFPVGLRLPRPPKKGPFHEKPEQLEDSFFEILHSTVA